MTDDVVEIRKVSDETLVGSAPDVTKNFIELRGIGIVDVKSMFGVQSVTRNAEHRSWSLHWKTGAEKKSMTRLRTGRRVIRNFSEIKSYATVSRSDREEILLLS